MFVYVGSRTTRHRNARGKGISVYKVINNNWELIQEEQVMDNPSYLTFDKTSKFLYCVHGDLSHASAYRILQNGKLSFINTVDIGGKNPVFITTNKTNKFIFIATLQGGSIVTLEILSDGSISAPLHIKKLDAIGTNGITHAHQCILDKQEKCLLVPTQGRHIGYERVYVFKVNDETGELIQTCAVNSRQYSEPRHIAISGCNKRAYLINEKGNAVTYYDFDANNALLTPLQILPSLPETYTGEGQASAILVHPNNKFVYASNRIHESIVTYRINEQTGFLTTLGYTDVLGKTPRFMTFDTQAENLLVANEDSDVINIFKINLETGSLEYKNQSISVGSPTCILIKE